MQEENDADLIIDSPDFHKGKLFLGNRIAAEDPVAIMEKEITVVISCVAHDPPVYDPSLVRHHLILPLEDKLTEDASKHFIEVS